MFQSIWPSGIVDIPIIASPTAAKTYDSRGVCYQNHHKERGPPQPPPKVIAELSNEQEAIKQKILKGKRQRELKKVMEIQERKRQIAQEQEQKIAKNSSRKKFKTSIQKIRTFHSGTTPTNSLGFGMCKKVCWHLLLRRKKNKKREKRKKNVAFAWTRNQPLR